MDGWDFKMRATCDLDLRSDDLFYDIEFGEKNINSLAAQELVAWCKLPLDMLKFPCNQQEMTSLSGRGITG